MIRQVRWCFRQALRVPPRGESLALRGLGLNPSTPGVTSSHVLQCSLASLIIETTQRAVPKRCAVPTLTIPSRDAAEPEDGASLLHRRNMSAPPPTLCRSDGPIVCVQARVMTSVLHPYSQMQQSRRTGRARSTARSGCAAAPASPPTRHCTACGLPRYCFSTTSDHVTL